MPGPSDPNFINNPHVQMFGRALADHINQTLAGMLTQVMAKMEQNLSPAGRVVQVTRRDERGKAIEVSTTTPQLLAELNDNITDLINTIQEEREAQEEPVRRRRR